jgi:hypothetical protein
MPDRLDEDGRGSAMSRERGSTGARRLGTCAAKVLQCFGFAVPLRKHSRYAETRRSGNRSVRIARAADASAMVGPNGSEAAR